MGLKINYRNIKIGKGWVLGDFEYKDNSVTGLSQEGKRKLRDNKDLVIPSVVPEEGAKSIKDLKPVEVIGNYAFHQIWLESVRIPESVKIIKKCAFAFNQITNITLHEGIEIIEDFAFSDNHIVEIVFPKSLKSIGFMAFTQNDIKNIVVKGKFRNFKNSLNESLYVTKLTLEDGESDEEDLSQISKIFSSIEVLDLGKLKIVKKIPNEAFFNREIKEVVFPPNIERIGFRAFRKNELKNIVIPDSVKIIEGEAFLYNPVENLKLGKSVVKIGKDAFPNTKEVEKELFRIAVKN